MKRIADKQSPWHIPTSVFISFPILFPSQISIVENNKDKCPTLQQETSGNFESYLPELKSGPCIFCGLRWVH